MMCLLGTEREDITKRNIHTKDDKSVSFINAYTYAEEGKSLFLENMPNIQMLFGTGWLCI